MGGILDLTALQPEDYQRIITQLHNEVVAKDARIKGVESLAKMLHEAEQKSQRMQETAKNYELTLKRAEARIAQLNKMHGIGPQTAFNRGVVIPGVSRKDFDLVTRENEKLKKALQHIVSTEIEGHAVVLVSEELRVKL